MVRDGKVHVEQEVFLASFARHLNISFRDPVFIILDMRRGCRRGERGFMSMLLFATPNTVLLHIFPLRFATAH